MQISLPLSLRRALPRLALLFTAAVPATFAQADVPLPDVVFHFLNTPTPEQEILGKFLFWE